MIELTLSHEAEAYGRRVRKRYDRSGVTDKFRGNGPDKRWTGHAVEYELHQFLQREGIDHRWNGGLDNKADYELGDREEFVRVAVKANSGDGPRDDFLCMVQERDVRKLADGVLFVIVSPKQGKLWIAGYIDAESFRRYAQRHRKGDEGVVPDRPIINDCRTIRASELKPAEEFFELMRLACV